MWWLCDGAFCCAPVCLMDLLVKGETVLDGDQVVQRIVAIDRVYQRGKKALNGDNGVMLTCRLLKVNMCLLEGELCGVGNIGDECRLDSKKD